MGRVRFLMLVSIVWPLIFAASCCPWTPALEGVETLADTSWQGSASGSSQETVDGASQEPAERSVNLQVDFDDRGALAALTTVGPTGWFWPTDLAGMTKVGDTADLSVLTNSYSLQGTVRLTEASYGTTGARFTVEATFQASNPGNWIEGTSVQIIELESGEAGLTVSVEASFDYQRGNQPDGPTDPDAVSDIEETLSATGLLTEG